MVSPPMPSAARCADGIDAARHAADDGEPGVRQIGRQTLGGRGPVLGGPAGADHAQRDRLEQVYTGTAREQRDRRIENLSQAGRVRGIGKRNQASARFEHFLLLVDGVIESTSAGDGLRHAAGESSGFELRSRGAEDRLRRAELFQELVRLARAEAGDEAEGEPVELFFFGDGGGNHREFSHGGAGTPLNFSKQAATARSEECSRRDHGRLSTRLF